MFLNQKLRYYFFLMLTSTLISLGVLYFMSFLISTGKNPKFSIHQNVNIEFLLNTPLDELELRSRHLPKKPKQKEPAPEKPKLKIQQTKLEKPDLLFSLPQLDLPDNFQSDSKGINAGGQVSHNREATPIFRINAIYPRRALLQRIEGFVVLKFDITETGQTDNVSVMQASPPQIFNESAIQALRKWKYKAKIENGRPVRQKNLEVTLVFEMEN